MASERIRRSTSMKNQEQLISQRDAAERLGIHVTTMRGWVREGRVPSYRTGRRFVRIDWSELLASIVASRSKHGLSGADSKPSQELVP